MLNVRGGEGVNNKNEFRIAVTVAAQKRHKHDGLSVHEENKTNSKDKLTMK